MVGPEIRVLIGELKGEFTRPIYSSKTTNEWLETALRAEHLQRCSVRDPILHKCFSHPSLIILLFFATETVRVNSWGTTNSKPPGPIIMVVQSATLISSTQIVFITLFYMQVQSSGGAERC